MQRGWRERSHGFVEKHRREANGEEAHGFVEKHRKEASEKKPMRRGLGIVATQAHEEESAKAKRGFGCG